MATSKPRFTVTVPEDINYLLDQLSRLQGQSKSSIVVELLCECQPILERVAVVLQAAESAKGTMTDSVRGSLERAQAALDPLMDEALSQFDIFARDVSEAVSGGVREGDAIAGGDAPRSRPRATQPPHSNTGVRSKPRAKVSSGKKQKNPLKTKH